MSKLSIFIALVCFINLNAKASDKADILICEARTYVNRGDGVSTGLLATFYADAYAPKASVNFTYKKKPINFLSVKMNEYPLPL